MKGKFSKLILSVLALSLVLGGAAFSAAPAEAADKKLDVAICGGSIGGAWAAIGEGVGEVIRRSYPGSNTAYEVGQEAANIVLVSRGRIQLGIAHAQLLKLGMEGSDPFREAYDNLRALMVLYGEAVEHFVVRSDAGISTFDELKDKQFGLRLNLNTKDSFMEIVGRKVLEAYGITYDDLASWGGAVNFMSMSPSLDLMRDGKIQAYSNVIQVPSSHIVDVSTNVNLTLLPLSEEAIAKVNEELGTYGTVIPKEQYSFLNTDVPTVGATVVLFTNADLPDEDAYAILTALKENFDYFRNIHSSLRSLTVADMAKTAPVPLHPGAVKFFEENK